MARRIFYSFHYKPDSWRTSQVRNIGVVEGNKPATDNDWETVTKGGDVAIRRWIAEQMKGRSCTIVLVGENTAGRKWINYEIIKSWNEGMGVVGIRIHGLKNQYGDIAKIGWNPFESISCEERDRKLSEIVKCYDPAGRKSNEIYDWISKHLRNVVEEAIEIRRLN